jgi:hypothetical protein
MPRAIRENARCALLALTGSALTAMVGLQEIAWGGDYERESQPAFEALAHGHLIAFLQRVPAYGGSLVERAPFALVPGLWGGGEEAVYRLVALPCLLAGAALAVWLLAQVRAQERSSGRRLMTTKIAVLCLCVANPITVRALELGHPEELLGAVLCVWGVLLAQRGKALSAGVVLGLAIANKEWAIVALGPALIALPSRRMLMLGGAGATAALVLAPMALVGGGGFLTGARASAAPAGVIFQPMQVFWFLGHHSARAGHLLGAVKHDFRLAPSWIGELSHPLIIAVALPLTLLCQFGRGGGARSAGSAAGAGAARSAGAAQGASGGQGSSGAQAPATGRGAPRADPLLLLALLLLLRCMLDTWDNVYYPLPFVVSLLVWEVCSRRRPPVLGLAATAIVWFNGWLSLHASADFQAALFLAWSLPLTGYLCALLYMPGRLLAGLAQETTVSSLLREVRISPPSGLTTIRSSIRTPQLPGR